MLRYKAKQMKDKKYPKNESYTYVSMYMCMYLQYICTHSESV